MSTTPTLRVAEFLPRSRANGPGVRCVLWVQGCPQRCEGCFNPAFLPFAGGSEHSPAEVAAWILAATDAEGVTFSGGEPFAQAAALAEVAQAVRVAGRSVIAFTGYEWAALRDAADPGQQALLAACDALIAGPYRRELPGSHPLLASGNQEIICLTPRYRREDFDTPHGRRREYHIGADGTLTVTGFPRAQSDRSAEPGGERNDRETR